MRRPRRTAAAIAVRNEIVEFIIYLRVLQQSNILYHPRFGIFFLFEKENACKRKAKQGESPCTPANAAPQYIARGSKLVARHIRAQTRRSLNECALVRLASQAVPSPFPDRLRTLRRGYGKLDYKNYLSRLFLLFHSSSDSKSQFAERINTSLLYPLQ